jgi:hypothetical protein
MPHPNDLPTIPIGTRVRILPSRGGLLEATTVTAGVAGARLEIRLESEADALRPDEVVLLEADLGGMVVWFEGRPIPTTGSGDKVYEVAMPQSADGYRVVGQRGTQRFAVQCDVDVTTTDGSIVFHSKAMDLGPGGARIQFDEPIGVGRRLELRLHLALDPRPVNVTATVIDELPSTMHVGRYIVRLAFENVDDESAARISQHCARAQADQKRRKHAD